jgi:hypothetical protein
MHGIDGEAPTQRKADHLLRDIQLRRVGYDVITPPDVAEQVQVATTFMVEPSFITAEKGGPWETLICVLSADNGDEGWVEVAALRWPNIDVARLAHQAIVSALTPRGTVGHSG